MSAGAKEVSRGGSRSVCVSLLISSTTARIAHVERVEVTTIWPQVVTKCITRGMTADILANTGFFSSQAWSASRTRCGTRAVEASNGTGPRTGVSQMVVLSWWEVADKGAINYTG